MSMNFIQKRYADSPSGAASFEFINIPNTYTDLFIVTSLRSTSAAAGWADAYIRFNSTSTNLSSRAFYTWGSTVSGLTATEIYHQMVGGGCTAGVFSNSTVEILNYASTTTNKNISVDTVTENQGTSIKAITGGVWANTQAITSIQIVPATNTFAQYSSATLYGVTKGFDGTTAVSP